MSPALLRAGRLLAAALAGGLHTLAFAPWELWPLQVLSIAALVALLQGQGARGAAALGVAYASAWFTSGLWWLYISMHDYGGVPAVLAALAVLLLALFLSLHLAVALALWARWRPARPAAAAGGFALVWLAAELARAQAFTGFPWMASGYVHSSGPLQPWAPWVGVYGLGALAAWCVAAAVLAWWPAGRAPRAGRRWLVAGAPAALVVGLGQILPQDFTEPAGTLRVSLLQPSVPQDVKFDPDRIVGNLAALSSMLVQAQGQLVVTPESVVPLSLDQLPEGAWEAMTAPFQAPGRAVLVGLFTGDTEQGFVNSLLGAGAGASPAGYVYGKRHLLPFGEFVPPGFRWFVEAMGIPMADQASGRQEAPLAVGGQRVRPLICYEDLFGEDFAGVFLREDAPTLLANVSNLAWFGRSMIQEQHLQFSRLRALEFQRPLVRATNTGATGVVDHQGRWVQALPAWTPGVLEATVTGRTGTTPYAHWLGRLGLWPLWGVVLVGAAVLLRPGRGQP
ncbi:apolipoprotein N-acyltransferase [Ideonella livida]|uniref:Apolipoprotein N-acyltransferase n=1 Tax=Ideonella livida TaxID=2707176 RepID=A0A7C9TLU1_9BURK|nr:apolipoprotein N-acyltransferase [Ideonella livida]NDY91186.1 apolipoprotein N-acyltransferase [Ideonella livida]